MSNWVKKNQFFLISTGAVPGALVRWQIDDIFLVNIIGCFLLGLINSLPVSRKCKLIFGFGFCGSLTSFTGWSLKLFQLLSRGLFKLFFLHSVLIVLIGFFAIFLGDLIAKKIN
tara:strand:+ start:776 stop:1117 length:342 start_codon:yes stop_codon:yes gene_type:complete